MTSPVVQTADGSSTLFDPRTGDHYHSLHGAESESNHVFIEAGLKHVAENKSRLRILEIGMGTGLNALLTFAHTLHYPISIEYLTLEPFPPDPAVIGELNYRALYDEASSDFFKSMHASPWEEWLQIGPAFRFKKSNTALQDFQNEKEFDLVYYDAFGPRYQPEMWTEEIFRHLKGLLLPGAILVTYCAQGAFKRHLKAAGFYVESLPGPKGKWEMTRGRIEN